MRPTTMKEVIRVRDGTMDQFPRLKAMRLRREQEERDGQLYKLHLDMAMVAARRARQAEKALKGANRYLSNDIAKYINEGMGRRFGEYLEQLVMTAASEQYREHGGAGLITLEIPAEWLRMMDPASLQKKVFDYYVDRYVRQMDCRFRVPDFGETAIDDTMVIIQIDVPPASYRHPVTQSELGLR